MHHFGDPTPHRQTVELGREGYHQRWRRGDEGVEDDSAEGLVNGDIFSDQEGDDEDLYDGEEDDKEEAAFRAAERERLLKVYMDAAKTHPDIEHQVCVSLCLCVSVSLWVCVFVSCVFVCLCVIASPSTSYDIEGKDVCVDLGPQSLVLDESLVLNSRG